MDQGIWVIQRILTLDIRRSLLSTEPKPAHQAIGDQTTLPVSKQLDRYAFVAGLHAYLSSYTNQSINSSFKITLQQIYSKDF